MFSIKSANPNRLLVRGILSIGVGVSIISIPDLSIEVVMRALGVLLLIDGGLAFLINYFSKKKPQGIWSIVPRGTSNIIIGIILLIFPTLLVNIFVFVIGIILIMAGFSQLVNQLGGLGKIKFSVISFLISLIAFGSGVLLITKPFESAETIMIFFGVIVAIYGIGEIFWSFKIRKAQKQTVPSGPEIIDTDYEEVE